MLAAVRHHSANFEMRGSRVGTLKTPATSRRVFTSQTPVGIQTPVSVNKNTPPDKKAGRKISFEQNESRAGLQFLLLGRMAKAHVKGTIFSQTPVCFPANCSPFISALPRLPTAGRANLENGQRGRRESLSRISLLTLSLLRLLDSNFMGKPLWT